MSDRRTARSRVLRLGWGAGLLWTIMSGLLFGWQIGQLRSDAVQHAVADAKAHIQKDISLRLWASKKGGIYVRPDEQTPPNPYLAHLPRRDVSTTDGQTLTLMNPNYLVRQVMQEFADLYGVHGRIVGAKAINPDNLADPWEQEKLSRFTQDQQLAYQLLDISPEPYLRVIQSIVMRESCLACHGHLAGC